MRNRPRLEGAFVPTLIYDDVPRACAWLCEAFAFRLRLQAGNGHAQLAFGNGGVMLGASRDEPATEAEGALTYAPPASTGRVSQPIFVTVDDVAAHHRHALDGGARIVRPLEVHVFGERRYTAVDPAVHRWTFSQSIDDVDPVQWGAEQVT